MALDKVEGVVRCDECGSTEVYSSDNQHLWHPNSGWGDDKIDESTPQFDSALYITFICNEEDCGCEFEEELEVVVPKDTP